MISQGIVEDRHAVFDNPLPTMKLPTIVYICTGFPHLLFALQALASVQVSAHEGARSPLTIDRFS